MFLKLKRVFIGLTRSIRITSGEKMFETAQGEKVTLPCTYEVSEEDAGPLDVEWASIPADIQKNEEMVSRESF